MEDDQVYKLIFKLIRDIWKRTLHAADNYNQSAKVIVYPDRAEPPMERLLIKECASGDPMRATCSGPVLRTWRYQGTDFEEVSEQPASPAPTVRKRRVAPDGSFVPAHQFFIEGSVRFSISEDRRRVVFAYVFGPLHGRGCVYEVVNDYLLQHAQGTGGWVS